MTVLQSPDPISPKTPAPALPEEPDGVLLGRFNAGDHEAFRQLVARHLHWVYASARQQVSDKHLAEDVAQTVFLILARKAHSLQGEMRLSPWLFKVTRYTSLQVLRASRRREHHERKASEMAERATEPVMGAESSETPMLQESLSKLKLREREALLLRFYEGKSFPAVGAALGISEEAARKRVNRAVQSLRERLHRRGATMTPSVLVGFLAGHGAKSGALHASQVATGALSQTPAHGALADAVIRAMAMGKLKVIGGAIGGLALVVAGVIAVEAYIHPAPPSISIARGEPAVAPAATPESWSAQRVAAPAGVTVAPGWPMALPGSVSAAASVADLDGSGRLAVLVPCESNEGVALVNDKPVPSVLLYAFYADGTQVPGWPAELVTPEIRAGREATRGRYIASWCSSPSICSDGAGGSKIVLTTPYFLGLRVIDRNGKATTFHGGSQWANVPLVDLDGDGITDIVTGAGLMNLNGGAIKNWPPTHPLATVSGFAPCIGDAHRNGTLEVFQTFVDNPERSEGQAEVVGFDSSGHELSGWRHRIRLPRLVGFGPVMGDVSGDDQMEVIACSDDLHVWTADGKSAPGTHDSGKLTGLLKENVGIGSCAPTLADLDGDGKADIIVYDPRTHALRAWHGNGQPIGTGDGTLAILPTDESIDPKQLDWQKQMLGGGVSVADLGGDGVMDLFVGTFWVKWDPKARQATVTSFLDKPTVASCAQPTICDLDGDGNADVVVGLTDGRVFVEPTHMAYRPEWMQWVTANGNFQHTGVWMKPHNP